MVLCKKFVLRESIERVIFSIIFRDYRSIFDWQHVKYLKVNLCPSIHLFLEQFDIIFPHITCIQFNMGKYLVKLDRRIKRNY
jgi:hypothetical protein